MQGLFSLPCRYHFTRLFISYRRQAAYNGEGRLWSMPIRLSEIHSQPASGALPGNGFVPIYRRMAEVRLGTPVVPANLGVNGLTTGGLKQRLRTSNVYRAAVKDAQIITMSIGGNDLIKAARAAGPRPGEFQGLLQQALRDCKRNYSDIMGTLTQLKAGTRSPYIIRLVGLYNPYPQVDEATEWVRQFNRYASGYNSNNVGFASIYHEFAGNERGAAVPGPYSPERERLPRNRRQAGCPGVRGA
ncbi:GDSL-type esterase/lipase family protein [Paenibacillus rhizoplanae]